MRKTIISLLCFLLTISVSSVLANNSNTALIGQLPGGERLVFTERLVQDETDFPAPSIGKIQLENKHYIIDGIVSHSNTLVFPSSGGCKLSSTMLGGSSFLNYVGTGNQFEGTLTPTSLIVLDGLESNAGNGTFLNLTSSAGIGGQIGILNTNVLGGASCGILTNTIITINTCLFINMGDGFSFNNSGLIGINNLTFAQWKNNSITMLDYNGTIAVIEIINSRFDSKANEHVLNFPTTLNILNESVIHSSTFIQNPFASGSRDKTYEYLNFHLNSGIEDSTIIGTMFMNGNTINTVVDYQGADGIITGFADAGGGTVTVSSTGHGLSNGDEVCIVKTDNYNGSYIVSNVLVNSFEIITTYSGTESGEWEYGWIIITGNTDTDIIERCYLANNKLTFSNLRTILVSSKFTLNAVQAVAANKTYQFAVFKNNSRLPITKNQVELATSTKSMSLHGANEVVAGDVMEIRVRNMTDTQDVLISNVQFVIN